MIVGKYMFIVPIKEVKTPPILVRVRLGVPVLDVAEGCSGTFSDDGNCFIAMMFNTVATRTM